MVIAEWEGFGKHVYYSQWRENICLFTYWVNYKRKTTKILWLNSFIHL